MLGVFVLFQEKKNYLLKLILALIIPLLTEYIQNFIDLRRSDVIDLYYNYLGLFFGVLTILLIRHVKKLKITNLAIIDSLEISFSDTFNIITGESGSGKTILYKSICYLFGQRFKKDLRKGENKCIISGEIRIESNNYIIKRIFAKNSTKNFINDELVKLNDYKIFLAKSWESYGQHEQQLLIDETNHLGYLDLFSKTEILYQQYLTEYENFFKNR